MADRTIAAVAAPVRIRTNTEADACEWWQEGGMYGVLGRYHGSGDIVLIGTFKTLDEALERLAKGRDRGGYSGRFAVKLEGYLETPQ